MGEEGVDSLCDWTHRGHVSQATLQTYCTVPTSDTFRSCQADICISQYLVTSLKEFKKKNYSVFTFVGKYVDSNLK